mgnify:FL=1
MSFFPHGHINNPDRAVNETFLHCDVRNQEIRGANQILSFRWAEQTQAARRGPQNVAVPPKLLR